MKEFKNVSIYRTNHNIGAIDSKEVGSTRKLEKILNMGELAAGFTHDIATPLTNIKINLQLLEKKIDSDEIKYAMTGIQQLDSLLSNFSLKLQGNDELMWFDVEEEVQRVLEMLHYQINNYKVNIALDLEPVKFFGDPIAFDQIIMNLVLNALESYEGDLLGQSSGLITVSGKKLVKYYDLSISDYGGGVNQGLEDKIFDAFFTTKGTKGTGLGLFIVKSLTKRCFNGSVFLLRNQNPTTFELMLKILNH